MSSLIKRYYRIKSNSLKLLGVHHLFKDVLDYQVGTLLELSSTNSTSSTKQIICYFGTVPN